MNKLIMKEKMDASYYRYRQTSIMEKCIVTLSRSADEKLRSLGHHKQHSTSKDTTSGVTGQPHLPVQLRPVVTETAFLYPPKASLTQSQSSITLEEHNIAPPRPPPPNQLSLHTTTENLNDVNMSERRIQRIGRREQGNVGTSAGKQEQHGSVQESRSSAIKRRSRSEGPAGRLKPRNSMDEKKMHEVRERGNKQYRNKNQMTRHSMYTEPLSDDGFPDVQGSSSSATDSDQDRKTWVKNPLMVKKVRKNDKRKSLNTAIDFGGKENRTNQSEFLGTNSSNRSPQISNRDASLYQEKSNNNGSQKAKYQKLEERRKKRVDILVTSDEELNSPELRISRLRQRALQGSKLATKLPDRLDDLDIQQISKSQPVTRVPHLSGNSTRIQQEPAENGSSSSEQITLRPIGPGQTNFNYDSYRQFEVENNRANSRFDEASNSSNINLKESYHGYLHQNREGQGRVVQGQGYKKIPKQESDFMGGNKFQKSNDLPKVSLQRSESYGSADVSGKRYRELPQGGITQYSTSINQFSSNMPSKSVQKHTGSDTEMNFRDLKSNRPMVLKKAIDRVDNKRKSHSDDDSLDELIESNIQYLESEIESGRLKMPQSTPSQSQIPPQEAVKKGEDLKKKPSSVESVPRVAGISNSPFQNEVKLRLQIPSVTNSPRPVIRSVQPSLPNDSSGSSSSLSQYDALSNNTPDSASPTNSNARSVYTHVFQNTVPKMERRNQSVTHSPYLQRRSTDLVEMEDLSKSDSQLNSGEFPSGYSAQYLQPQSTYIGHANSSQTLENLPHEDEQTLLKSLSVPAIEQGMFSDVEYDIEVSERVKKWEKFMKKKKPTDEDSKTPLSLTTILESEGGIPDAWLKEAMMMEDLNEIPSRSASLPQKVKSPPSRAVSSVTVTVTKSTSHIAPAPNPKPPHLQYQHIKQQQQKQQQQQNKQYLQEQQQKQQFQQQQQQYLQQQHYQQQQYQQQQSSQQYPKQEHVPVQGVEDPKVLSTETGTHRVFRLVKEPGGTAITKASDSSVSYIQSTNSFRSKTYAPTKSVTPMEESKRARRAVSEEQLEKDDKSGINVPFKQAWPPRRNKSFSEEQKQARLSKFEEELSELQELKQDSVKDLRKKFDSDASGNEGTDTYEETLSATRTPVIQRKQFIKSVEKIPETTQMLEEKIVTKVNCRENKRPSELKDIAPKISEQVTEKEVWSPHLESSKGLVSIERVKARTLQTIPFSEDPFWKQIEEMTSFDQLMKSGEAVTMAEEPRPEESIAYIKQNQDEDMMCTSYSQVVATATTGIPSQAPSSNSLPLPTTRAKSFSTPEIQPLKLGQPVVKSSVTALDEVLEDIRSSLQRKSTSGTIRSAPVEKESPFYSPLRSPVVQPVQIPVANIPRYQPVPVSMTTNTSRTITHTQHPMAAGVQSIAHSVPTYQSQRLAELQNQLSVAKQQAQATTAMVQQQQQLQQKQQQLQQQQQPVTQAMHYIPEYSADPYIVNGNYQLDPLILKEKLLDTGLAELSDSGGSVMSPTSARNTVTPAHMVNQLRQNEAEKQVLQTVEDLKNLARDVEHRLSQIRNRIESTGNDENRLDSILFALRNFAPSVEPTVIQQPTVQLTSEYHSRKTKLQEALSELDKIYENLNISEKPESITTTVTTEKRGHTIPRQSRTSDETHVEYRPQIKRRNKSDSDFTTSNYSAESIAEVERETQREFEDITQAFQNLLAEVDRDSDNDIGCSTPTPKDPQSHAEEIEASIESFLQEFRKSGKTSGGGSATFNKAIEGLTSKDVAVPNTCRDIQKSEVFSTYSGPFSVLVGINGNSKRGTKGKPRSEESSTALARVSPPQPAWHMNPMHSMAAQTNMDNAGKLGTGQGRSVKITEPAVDFDEVFSSVLENLSDSSEQSVENVKVSSRRGKRHPMHRKSMPAEMLKRSIETQTIETQTDISPVTEVKKDKVKPRAVELLREDSISSESSIDARGPQKKKVAKNVAMMVEIFSSSEDERGRRMLTHSHSAPDLRELFDTDKSYSRQNSNTQSKIQTPKMVKQRYEARAKKKAAQYTRETSTEEKGDDFAWTSATSDDGSQVSQGSKPPLHPKHKQKSTSPDRSILDGKSGSRKGSSNDGDSIKSEVVLRKKRRRTSSSNSQEEQERPHSFHELVAMFETNPDHLKKLTNSLRRCASADMVYMETVLRKSYHSEPDLRDSVGASVNSAKLFLEIQVKS